MLCCAQELFQEWTSLHARHHVRQWEHRGLLEKRTKTFAATPIDNPLIIFKMGMASPPSFLKVLGQACPKGLCRSMSPNVGKLVRKETEKKNKKKTEKDQ